MFDCPLLACFFLCQGFMFIEAQTHSVLPTHTTSSFIFTYYFICHLQPNDSWPAQASGKILLHFSISMPLFLCTNITSNHTSRTPLNGAAVPCDCDPRPRSLYCINWVILLIGVHYGFWLHAHILEQGRERETGRASALAVRPSHSWHPELEEMLFY